MGIGDVSLPLCDAVIKALHEAVDDQASKSSFHGYMPECGAPFLREAIVKYYAKRGISLSWMIKLQKVVFMDICQNVVLHF